MSEEDKVDAEKGHEDCRNPCEECHGKGYLENGELCPTCAGTGCKDRTFCTPAGGLGCDTQ